MALNPKPAPAANGGSKSAIPSEDLLPIVGGGALALLAAGGAATLIGRRRRRQEQEWADEQTMSYEDPFHATPTATTEPVVRHESEPEPSAFAWGAESTSPASPRADEPQNQEDDRRPGETWVERAYRGPTPNNPSASLRNRLRRAAFFDKREREVAAGLAKPVDATAGLPEAAVEERQREFA